MDTKLRTLVVDSDLSTRSKLSHILQSAGHEVVVAADIADARQKLAVGSVNIVISYLHDGAARPVGLEILKEVRTKYRHCEVILITQTPDLETAIEALREGACDYLSKPLMEATVLESVSRAQNKLTLRLQQEAALISIEANIRKVLGYSSPYTSPEPEVKPASPPAEPNECYTIGPVTMDLTRHVIEVNGQAVGVTPSEISILGYLCRNPRRVVTPQELIRFIRGYTAEARDAQEIIRAHISNLRRKLSSVAPDADIIVTVRSVGYSLKMPPQRTA
jgi:DNA-binding response OmpR family regulator